MDEYREAQRQKWLAAQDQAGSGSAKGEGSFSMNERASSAESTSNTGPVSAPSTSGTSKLNRVHILPVNTDPNSDSGVRLEMLAPELRIKRASKEMVRTGSIFRANDHEFVIVSADPNESVITHETDFFVEGKPAKYLKQVHFVCLWDWESGSAERSSNALFNEYIQPFFRDNLGVNRGFVVRHNQIIRMRDRELQAMALDPDSTDVGIVNQDTIVYVDWDSTPEFQKIHIVPFQDTLPSAYEYNLFDDYLKPYLTRNKHANLAVNDYFTYQGIQFKVVCCEPSGPARVGKNTTIYCEGVLHPSLRNFLPPELLEQLANLPPGLQMLLLNTDALAGGYEERLMEVQEMLNRRRGLGDDMIDRIEKFRWGEGPAQTDQDGQTQCMVCLCDFDQGEEVRRLPPCQHLFHAACIDEWLRRCTDCPICKANVDRAV